MSEPSPNDPAHSGRSGGGDGNDGNPVREMFVLAALYLPMAFFIWFSFSSALMWLPGRLLDLALTGLYPAVFDDVIQFGFRYEVQTGIQLSQTADGRIGLLTLQINPMIYAWGMALLFGLTMATPTTVRRRLVQLVVSYLLISLIATWGSFWETWVNLAFQAGEPGAAAVAGTVLSPTAIALMYQLGYLMLPAVVPLAAWILMNRPFLERVAFSRQR
jgi:hypothetical protein